MVAVAAVGGGWWGRRQGERGEGWLVLLFFFKSVGTPENN
jgi:hypothetical protein